MWRLLAVCGVVVRCPGPTRTPPARFHLAALTRDLTAGPARGGRRSASGRAWGVSRRAWGGGDAFAASRRARMRKQTVRFGRVRVVSPSGFGWRATRPRVLSYEAPEAGAGAPRRSRPPRPVDLRRVAGHRRRPQCPYGGA
jgi:hypothetical protein